MLRLFPFLILVLSAVFQLNEINVAAQSTKDKVNSKGKASLLVPEPLEINPGEPLSIRTPVARPGTIKGVKSWTIETRRHRWLATSFSFSPDGHTVATGGYDGIIRLWDITSGKFIRALVGHGSYVYGLAFSPDGNVLASAGSFDGTVRIWNPKTGMTLRTLKNHKGYTAALAWLPDGNTLIVTGGTSGFATFWNVAKNSQIRTVEHGTAVTCVACSADGKYIACGTTSTTFLWNAETGKNITTLPQEGKVIHSVAWSPDSRFLLTGGSKNCEIWDIENVKSVKTLMGESYAVSWSATGKFIAACPASGPVQLFDAKTFIPRKPLSFGVRAYGWANEDTLLYGASSNQLLVCDLKDDAITRTTSVAADGTIVWTQGRPIVGGIGTNSPTLWDTATGKHLMSLDGHKGAVVASLWSRDGKYLATGSADKTARIWDPTTGKSIKTLVGHESTVSALAWSPDGKLATGSADNNVRIFHANSDKVQLLTGHTHPVTALAWSRDGRTFASGSADRTVIVWNIDGSKPLKKFAVEHDVQTIAISPDGRLIASGGSDDVVRVFSLASGKLLHSFDFNGSPRNVSCLAFSPDSNLIASGRGNHTMQLWSLKTEKIVHSVQTMAPVHSVAWTADGKTLATGTIDRSIRYWDVLAGNLRATLVSEDKQLVAIGAEGHYRVPAEADSEIVYVIQTDKAQETFEPKTLAGKYAWRNNPSAVKLTGN